MDTSGHNDRVKLWEIPFSEAVMTAVGLLGVPKSPTTNMFDEVPGENDNDDEGSVRAIFVVESATTNEVGAGLVSTTVQIVVLPTCKDVRKHCNEEIPTGISDKATFFEAPLSDAVIVVF